MNMILGKCNLQNSFPCFRGTHWNCLIEAIPMCTYNIYVFSINELFTIRFLKQILSYRHCFSERTM